MEQLDYSKILEKIGAEKNMSKLTEEELLYYDMVRAIQSKSADDERKNIQQAIRQYKHGIQMNINNNENRINMNTSNKKWIGIAAGVAILVVAYFFFSKPSKTTDEIFTSSFKTKSEYISKAKDKAMQFGMASTGTESRDSFLKGLKFYEENKFDEAMKVLAPYVESYPEDNDARFALALSQMNREKYAPAIINLSTLNAKQDLDVLFAEETKWNLALCYLKMVDGKKQAKVLFEQLVKSEGKFSKPAKANLEYL